METKKIDLVFETINNQRVIVKIEAYNKNGDKIFSYSNLDGIAKSPEALRIHKLIYRKNSSFKKETNSYSNKEIKSFTRK